MNTSTANRNCVNETLNGGAMVCIAAQETGEDGLLAPHMHIKPLLFPVDNFICIGERSV